MMLLSIVPIYRCAQITCLSNMTLSNQLIRRTCLSLCGFHKSVKYRLQVKQSRHILFALRLFHLKWCSLNINESWLNSIENSRNISVSFCLFVKRSWIKRFIVRCFSGIHVLWARWETLQATSWSIANQHNALCFFNASNNVHIISKLSAKNAIFAHVVVGD